MPKPETAQEQWLDGWADRIHQSGLAAVALPLLEIGRGFGFLAGQALLLSKPVLAGLIAQDRIERYVTLLEDSAAWERLIERVEQKVRDDG
jgi:hypothetical protein